MQSSIYQRIKFLREQLGKEQIEFANALKLSQSGYSSLERGRTKFKLSQIDVLCNTYNLDKNYILDGDANVQNSPKISQQVAIEFEMLKHENMTLKDQVKQLMEMVNNLTNSINMLSNKLGKLEGSQITYSEDKENECKIIALSTDSVTQAVKRAA